jgi:hypothetical protein
MYWSTRRTVVAVSWLAKLSKSSNVEKALSAVPVPKKFGSEKSSEKNSRKWRDR